MNYRNHVVVGASVLACTYHPIVASLMPNVVINTPLLFAVFALGTLFPDIDHPGSKLGKCLPFISIPLSVVFGHRTITHSWWLVLLWLSGAYFEIVALQVLFLGAISHLLADVLTGKIPLIFPLRLSIGFDITFGSQLIETLIAFSMLGASLIWVGFIP